MKRASTKVEISTRDVHISRGGRSQGARRINLWHFVSLLLNFLYLVI